MKNPALFIIVQVIDPETGNTIRRHIVNNNNPQARTWLPRLYAWAFTNGYIIEAMQKELYKKYYLVDGEVLTEIKGDDR